ncbi:MAG: type IV toxin-antitoxin system AbiEi family antitoxin domain-containing protein [bacterium]
MMKKIEALLILQKSRRDIFSLIDLKKLLRSESDNIAYIQANRLTKEGLLDRIAKGVYCLKDKKPTDFEIANFLYKPSYVSLESALAYYGILIQVPQVITSVTIKRAKKIRAVNKEFAYFHLDQRYYSDYIKEQHFLIATPEKAIVDTIFFASYGRTVINPEEWVLDKIDKKRLRELSGKIKSEIFGNFFDSLNIKL